jgi:hypothetical protein
LRCGPRAGGCLPRGRSLGHALLGSPTRGPMGCPGGRQRRAHPAHRRIEQRQRPCRRYGPAPEHPDLEPGRAAGRRTMGLRRQGAAPARNAWGWRATETVLAPPGRAWRDPVALLIAARAVCRFCCRTIGRTWGSLDDPEVPVNSADIPRSIPRLAQPAPVAPTYTPRSDGSGPNWETLRPQVGRGVVTRTRPPDSAAGLRADGQTREARESTWPSTSEGAPAAPATLRRVS